MLEDFEHARSLAVGNGLNLSYDQLHILKEIDRTIGTMEEPDYECFNNEALYRPVWEQLRHLASSALRIFGWEGTVVQPFVETELGVWRRPPVQWAPQVDLE
jgi:hypothetical protein